SIYIDSKPIYNYRINPNSTMHSKITISKLNMSIYSWLTIASWFENKRDKCKDKILEKHLLYNIKLSIREILRSLQLTGYSKDLNFTKSDLKRFYPYMKGKYKFCFHFPRIYGFPKRVRLFITSLFKREK
ncbi:MAG: hypothetical protein K2P17_08080, partial [Helicobacteraceae bacterium]|nr:hypothetical protein [Helicobacteraceae bacterium]